MARSRMTAAFPRLYSQYDSVRVRTGRDESDKKLGSTCNFNTMDARLVLVAHLCLLHIVYNAGALPWMPSSCLASSRD